MNSPAQPGASKTENYWHQGPYLQQNQPINICGPNVGRQPDQNQNQNAFINVSFNERPAPSMHDHQRQPELSITTRGQVGPNGHDWPLGDPGEHYGGQFVDTNGSSNHSESGFRAGHDLQYQYAAPQIPSRFTGQHQPFQTLPFWQPSEVVGFQQQLPRTDLQQVGELGYTRNLSGLLTPVSSNAQNSPPNELARGALHNVESESEQIWDHNFEEALEAHNPSDASAADVFFNDFTAPSEEQLWGDFDFDNLNNLFGVNDMSTLEESGGDSNAAAPMQDAQLPLHYGGCVPDSFPIQSFDPFLTGMNYPDPDSVGMSSNSTTAQQALYPVFMAPTATYNTAPTLPGLVDAFEIPSPAESVPRTPANSSQKDAKNALLIRCKEQGMAYKDIKALGGFEEAESTLRGRYRTLTKPKEERVRRPEWSDRDVALLFAAVDYLKPAHRQGQGPLSSRGTSERRRAAEKIPWKQVSEHMADHGSYKYGYGTVKRKYEEISKAREWRQ